MFMSISWLVYRRHKHKGHFVDIFTLSRKCDGNTVNVPFINDGYLIVKIKLQETI